VFLRSDCGVLEGTRVSCWLIGDRVVEHPPAQFEAITLSPYWGKPISPRQQQMGEDIDHDIHLLVVEWSGSSSVSP
jgi:hypothetical protein